MAASSWISQKCNFKQKNFKNSEYASIFIKCQKGQNKTMYYSWINVYRENLQRKASG